MAFSCPECDFVVDKKSELLKHQRQANHWRGFHCDICGARFTRKGNLDRHMQKHRNTNNVHCQECGRAFNRPDNLESHLMEKHQTGSGLKRPAESQNDGVVKRLRKEDDPRDFYTITKIKEQNIPKFRTTGYTYKVTFKDLEVTDDVMNSLRRLFSAIINDLTRESKSEDLMRLSVQSPSLDYPIVIPFERIPHLTVDRFMAEIERVIQSHEEFSIDESLIIETTLVNAPSGGAQKRCKFVNTDRFLAEKKCILQIQNDDDLCCARAIVTAKARLDHHEKWNSIRLGRFLQEKMARELHALAGVPIGKCGVDEIKRIQHVLPDYQIHVVSQEHFNGIIYKGIESDKKIYLYLHDNHYDVITKMPAFTLRNYYCTKCEKGYDHKVDHKCINTCYACRKVHDEEESDWLQCELCNRFFRGQTCFELHQQLTAKGNSTCKAIYRCIDCGKTVNRKIDKNHKCGQVYCNTCKDFFPNTHLCYMLPEGNDEEEPMSIEEEVIDEIENAKSFIFFDFECTQDDLVQCDKEYTPDLYGKCQHCLKSNCGSYEHKPNLCVVQKVCTLCMDSEDECENCGLREHVFKGDNTLEEFCQWLFSENNYQSTVICHNFQGYDSYPILQYLYKHAIVPVIVPNGAKIMALTVPSCKIKMIDSINFLPMALAKLPAMFDIKELKKGYYPHLYNRKENQTVVLDKLPGIAYYNPDGMKPSDREAFLKWYTENKDRPFDMQNELLQYCKSDVDILRKCCLKFRGNFMEVTGIDPFKKSITIASACNLVFRTNFLQPETIALIPPHGYIPEQKQSIKALQWIKYLSHKTGYRIQHSRNGGEKNIDGYRLDGYYQTEDGQKMVLEFNGDFWHGNPSKYFRSTVNPVSQRTMGELYDKTLEKQRYIESQGYIYQSVWESEFDQQVKDDPELRSFVEDLDMVTPLEPRDAFYGGLHLILDSM